MRESTALVDSVLALREDFFRGLPHRLTGLARQVLQLTRQPRPRLLARLIARTEAFGRACAALGLEELGQDVASLNAALRAVEDAGQTAALDEAGAARLRRRLRRLRATAKRAIEAASPAGDGEHPLVLVIQADEGEIARMTLQLTLIGLRVEARREMPALAAAADDCGARALVIDTGLLGDGTDALDAIRDVRPEGASLPAVILTSPSGDSEARLKAIRAGADGYFPMPVDVAGLASRVLELCAPAEAPRHQVMIVDDSRSRIRRVASALRHAGIVPHVAGRPERLCEQLAREPLDLVMINVRMRGTDARALAAEVRGTPGLGDVPVLLFTARDGDLPDPHGPGTEAEVARSQQLMALVVDHISRAGELRHHSSTARRPGELAKLSDLDYFLRAVEASVAIAAEGRQTFGVLYVGIDNVDAFLRDGTREQLHEFAMHCEERLLVGIRGHDVAARYADGAYVVLLKSAGAKESGVVGERIRANFSRDIFACEGMSFPVSCTIGIGLVDAESSSTEQVLADVQGAFEAAVAGGGNAVHLHERITDAIAREEREQGRIALVRRAVAQDGFQLMFEPIVDLGSQDVKAFEVVVALEDGQQGEITGAALSQLVAGAKMSVEVDRWLITRVVRFVAELGQAGGAPRMMVTLSPETLGERGFGDWMRKQIADAGIDPGNVVVRFATDAVSIRLQAAQSLFGSLRKAGVRTGLTHFGCAPNPLQILGHLELSFLSIDESIVAGVGRDARAGETLTAMVEAAHARKVAVVAPGVKEAGTVTALFMTSVDLIQGAFVGAASPTIDREWSSDIDLAAREDELELVPIPEANTAS